MPLKGFAGNAVEKETIVTPGRVLMEIKEISTFYGEDPDDPRPFDVKDENGKVRFTSDPYVNAFVEIVDDYGDGAFDGKRFWDKLYLSHIKSADIYAATKKGKLGRIFKTHPKYGPYCFDDPDTVYNENDLVGHRFEAQTEQRKDPNQKRLDGTRIAYETIGAIPDRSGKKKSKESDHTPEEEAQMEGALSKS